MQASRLGEALPRRYQPLPACLACPRWHGSRRGQRCPAAAAALHAAGPLASHTTALPAPCARAVALPYGRVALLLRCRVYDEQGRTYTLQHACLFHLEPPPAGGQATEGNHAAAQHQVAERQLAELPQQQARLQPQPQPPQPGSSPAAASAAAAWAAVGAPSDPLRLAWQGFVDMPGGGNK